MLASNSGMAEGGSAVRVVPETQGIVAVCLEGEFDIANATALREGIEAALATGDDLILDLDQATFVDSSVIHVLFESVRAAGARDQSLVLQLGSAPIVERLLELVAVPRVLSRAYDREEAIALIRRRAGGSSSQAMPLDSSPSEQRENRPA